MFLTYIYTGKPPYIYIYIYIYTYKERRGERDTHTYLHTYINTYIKYLVSETHNNDTATEILCPISETNVHVQ